MLCSLLNSCAQEDELINRFSGTEVYELVIAASKQDTAGMRELINKEKLNINYMNNFDGNSILMLCAINKWENSAKELVRLGADINQPNKLSGESALSMLCSEEYVQDCDLTLLRFFLDNGGDANFIIKDIDGENNVHQTVLMSAVSNSLISNESCINKVELLIAKGANINATTFDSTACAINYALIHDNLQAAKLLIFSKNVKIPEFALIRFQNTKDEEKLTIIDLLKESDFTDDPVKNDIKKEIIDYLLSLGYK